MSAVLFAFLESILKLIFFVAVAAAGIVCGRKLHERKKAAGDAAEDESSSKRG